MAPRRLTIAYLMFLQLLEESSDEESDTLSEAVQGQDDNVDNDG